MPRKKTTKTKTVKRKPATKKKTVARKKTVTRKKPAAKKSIGATGHKIMVAAKKYYKEHPSVTWQSAVSHGAKMIAKK